VSDSGHADTRPETPGQHMLSDAPLAAVREVDAADQLADVLAIPDHLRDALWRVESARLEPADSGRLVVCGMGGSAIGGNLAAAALGDRLNRPLLTVRGYELPAWVAADCTVLCSSYSGDTEETLACFEAATALGARRVVATTGGPLAEAARADGVPVVGIPSGLQPRAAVGYMFVVAAELAALCGVGPAIRTEIDSSASHLEAARDRIAERAAELARDLEGVIPVVYGRDLTAPVAYRWKTQLNENAKWPAFSHELPELDHNEIVGWQDLEPADGASPRLGAIFLTDRDQHPRVRERFDLTAKLITPNAAGVHSIETEGETRTERLLYAVMLGDLLSLQLAARRGIDPSPVAVIERLKDALGRP
jgi:glucose/mannose-6-phosphate isomerase